MPITRKESEPYKPREVVLVVNRICIGTWSTVLNTDELEELFETVERAKIRAAGGKKQASETVKSPTNKSCKKVKVD